MFTIVFNTESMWLWVPISPRRWWFRFNWDVQDFHLRLFTGFTMTFGTCVALVPWPSRWPLGTGVFLWGVSFHVTLGHPFHSAGLSENRAMTWRIVAYFFACWEAAEVGKQNLLPVCHPHGMAWGQNVKFSIKFMYLSNQHWSSEWRSGTWSPSSPTALVVESILEWNCTCVASSLTFLFISDPWISCHALLRHRRCPWQGVRNHPDQSLQSILVFLGGWHLFSWYHMVSTCINCRINSSNSPKKLW